MPKSLLDAIKMRMVRPLAFSEVVQVLFSVAAVTTRLVRGAGVGIWITFISTLGFVCLLTPFAQAQPAESEWVTESWQADTGLPHSSITALAQTLDGYLWLGTSNGLVRFDGVRFTTFRAMDHPGLRSNRILSLFVNSKGELWAGTEDGGVAIYHDGIFASLTMSEGLPSDAVLSVGEDKTGTMWVGTSAGLARWINKGGVGFFKAEGLVEDLVYALCPGAGAAMFIGTQRGFFEFSQERVASRDSMGAKVNPHPAVYCLTRSSDSCVWLCGERGLVKFGGGGEWALHTPELPSAVVAMGAGQGGEVWCGTRSGDLYRIQANGGNGGAVLVGRFPSAITDVLEDHEGNWWIGTAANGLHRLKRRELRWAPFALASNEIQPSAIFETSTGDLGLLGTDRCLYRCVNGQFKKGQSLALPEGTVVQTICETSDGTLWLGTLSDGLFEYRDRKLSQMGERDGLSDSGITALCVEADGGLWVGTRNGGLNRLQGRTVVRFNTPWGFRGGFAAVLAVDNQTNLWIGTSGDGLFRLAGGRFASYGPSEGLSSGSVRTLHVSPDSLWVGTDQGLCRVKAGKVSWLGRSVGLAEDPIYQLRTDARRDLWIGSSSGIVRVSEAQLNAFIDGRGAMPDSMAYGKEDGLPGFPLINYLQAASRQNHSGGVWFATGKGLVLGTIPSPPRNQAPPPVVLETVLVENERVTLADPIRVPPGKESLQFRYTALSFAAPGKVAFRYQLEGFDREWSELTSLRTARYPKLPPGKYRFRVAARNNDGVWNGKGASIGLVVIPFWWATDEFRVGLVVLGLMVAAAIYRFRQSRQRELERLRVRIAGDLHDDIGSSLWSITLLSRMLAQHGSMSPEEKEDINEIHSISVQASNSIRDIIWLINPAFDSLQDLTARLNEFAGATLRGCRYQLDAHGVDLAKRLPLDFRQNLFFFLKEALANIARHAEANVAEVLIQSQGGRWQFQIRDNGKGFSPDAQHAGHGLKSLRSRALKMDAALEILSHPGNGTRIILTTRAP